jgi:hypothetical protein
MSSRVASQDEKGFKLRRLHAQQATRSAPGLLSILLGTAQT